MRRTVILGLDCVPLRLVRSWMRPVMPRLNALFDAQHTYHLRSSFPPITVPAWTCMASGKDPGELGIYGFRAKIPGQYGMRVYDNEDVTVPRLWEAWAAVGERSCALAVPLTWPPKVPANLAAHTTVVSGMLTPDAASPWCSDPSLSAALPGPYLVDVEGHRQAPTHAIIERARQVTSQRFAWGTQIWRSEQPRLMFMVDIAPDRVHHAAWQHIDPSHPSYTPDPGVTAYYAHLDRCIGEFLDTLGSDTDVIVASDHGAKPERGLAPVNRWLLEAGLLAETDGRIDWSRTRVWAEGGYYARVFLNLRGREAAGTVGPEDAEAVIRDTEDMFAARGAIANRPEAIYRAVCGNPPDLLVTFGDLSERATGRLGEEGDTGGCVHDWLGLVSTPYRCNVESGAVPITQALAPLWPAPV